MKITEENNKLTIFLEGRFYNKNADQIEQEIFSVIGDRTKDIIIDAEKLTYLSSAGLRVLTRL